jgi:voltage-gated potassium channel
VRRRESEIERDVERLERVCQLDSGRVKHPFELVVLALSLLMLPAVLIQDSTLHDPWGEVADGLGAFVWLVFAAELAFTLSVAKDKRAALRAHWHDALVVFVIFPAWGPLFSVFGSGWLRGWRLARLIAIVARLFRAERLLSRRHNLPYVAALTMVLVVVAGIAISETDHGRFPNPWRGLWWAVVTVTTVGYGDTFPTSVGGRVVGGVLMVIGIGFLGTATAAIASHFVNTDSTKRHREVSDKHREILAELKQISERLAALERRR